MRRPVLPFSALACLALLAPSPELLAADGDLDTDFGGGTLRLLWGNDGARATTLEPLPGGRLLVGGTVDDPPRWAVSKLWDNGSIDLGWATTFTPFGFGNEGANEAGSLYDLQRDEEGRTTALGWVEAGPGLKRPALARLTSAGALDPAFDANGLKIVATVPAGWSGLGVNDAAFLPDGGAVFVGACENCPHEGLYSLYVLKVLASGAPDTGFSGDGWKSFTQDTEINSGGVAVTTDDHGRIVVVGVVSSFPISVYYVARFLPDGGFDPSFGGGDGVTDLFFPAGGSWIRDVAVEPSSGRIAMAQRLTAEFPSGGAVQVLTDAGVPDTTFSEDGVVELDLEEGSSVDAVAFQSDGRLLAAGNIDPNGAQTGGFFLARMTKAGALDNSFDGNGVKRVEFDAAENVDDGARAVTTWSGKLVAAGYAGSGGGDAEGFAVLRTENRSIFTDGFERGSSTAWLGD